LPALCCDHIDRLSHLAQHIKSKVQEVKFGDEMTAGGADIAVYVCVPVRRRAI
jgi:hypothetical protein